MKAEEIIFGIKLTKDEDLRFIKVYLGYEETWNETKNAYDSQIFLDEDNINEEELDDLFKDIPSGHYDTFITLSYDYYCTNESINKIKEDFIKAGFKYNSEFEKAIVKEYEK